MKEVWTDEIYSGGGGEKDVQKLSMQEVIDSYTPSCEGGAIQPHMHYHDHEMEEKKPAFHAEWELYRAALCSVTGSYNAEYKTVPFTPSWMTP